MASKVAVMVGSLRQGSINAKLAKVLEKLSEGKLVFDHVRIDDLPLYNEDLWEQPPASVLRMKQQVSEADALLVLTPEYNRSYPGLLKNAFDWGSRPYGTSCWRNKPAAVTGTSPGQIGTAVAQCHLRNDLLNLSAVVMHAPEAYVQWKADSFAEDGTILNEATGKFLHSFVQSFESWIVKHG